jgi:hypothetical protein
MKIVFSALMVVAISLSIAVSADDLPYSNVEAIHSAEVVLIGKIQYRNQTQKTLQGYELPRAAAGQEGLVTYVDFVVVDNLGDGNYSSGTKLGVEIPDARLQQLAQGKNGNLLAQSNDVLLGFDVLETDSSGSPLRYGVKTQEFIIADNNTHQLHEWVDSIRGADTPTLNRLMGQEWTEKGLDGAALQQQLDDEYNVRINSPIAEDAERFKSDADEENIIRGNMSSTINDSLSAPPVENDAIKLTDEISQEAPVVAPQTLKQEKNIPIIYVFLAFALILLAILFWVYKKAK